MQDEHIAPFVNSLKTAFRTMLACDVHCGDLALKESRFPRHEVSGVIGLSGKAVGTVVLSLSTQVALKAASTMLLSEAREIDDDVLDAVGELTNVIAGAAKGELEEFELMSSLPSVITGCKHDVHFPSNVPPVCVQFQTDWGPLSLEVGLAPVTEPAGV